MTPPVGPAWKSPKRMCAAIRLCWRLHHRCLLSQPCRRRGNAFGCSACTTSHGVRSRGVRPCSGRAQCYAGSETPSRSVGKACHTARRGVIIRGETARKSTTQATAKWASRVAGRSLVWRQRAWKQRRRHALSGAGDVAAAPPSPSQRIGRTARGSCMAGAAWPSSLATFSLPVG